MMLPTSTQTLPPPGWITLPAAPLNESGVVHLFEPAERDPQKLIRQLLDGVYPRPFVLDNGQVRRLHFSLRLVQSEMRIDAPDELTLAYTRRMMGFLLFNPTPKHVVIVGLGGGSLTKFCHRALSRCRLTTLEVSAGVIACRPWFMIPPDDERLRIVHADAADYFASTSDGADAILLDAYDEDGVAPQVCSAAFYGNVRRHLKPNGLLVANIVGHGLVADTHIDLIRQSLDNRIVIVDVNSDGNRIVFGFNSPYHPPAWNALERTARELDDRHGLDLARLLREMAHNEHRQRRKARR